jgi:quinol-cytochrome oxidoreductase complex cytochrome b subunit
VTGIYLMFFYTPSITAAYGDMQRLRTSVGFGQLLRNVHRWSAHLMVLVVALHLVRVFWDGAYKAPRQFNWVIGVGLLVVTLAYSFTGYLLPWDQLSYWAVTVGSDLLHYVPVMGRTVRAFLLGGEEIGQATLLRFYVLHVAVLTMAFAVLIVVHIWRVRKDGFAVRPEPVEPDAPVEAGERLRLLGVVDRESVTAAERVPDGLVFTWPHLIVRHQVVALGTCAVAVLLGILFAAPLQDFANPMLTPEPAKAPWYFVGLQELLAHFDPLIAGILTPAALGLGLLLLPYVDRNPSREPARRKVAIVLFSLIMTLAVVLTVIGALFRGPGWRWIAPWVHLYLEM